MIGFHIHFEDEVAYMRGERVLIALTTDALFVEERVQDVTMDGTYVQLINKARSNRLYN